MSECVRITVLVENSVQRPGLLAQHGLAFHVQIGKHSLLFDTGQTDLVLINAATLHIPLESLEAIVLSHGHYDHTGGVPAILDAAPGIRPFLHPAAFEPKYSKGSNGDARFIGMSRTAAQTLHRRGCIETTGWTQVLDGIYVTGEIPRFTTYEDTGGPFFLDTGCTRPDPLLDDEALVIETGKSVVALLGCAHAGVVNTLNHVQRMTGGKPIRAVIGGFHLGSASYERIQKTISRLREVNLDCLAPVHCTGWAAAAQLWQAFPKIYRTASVGTVLEFDSN